MNVYDKIVSKKKQEKTRKYVNQINFYTNLYLKDVLMNGIILLYTA